MKKLTLNHSIFHKIKTIQIPLNNFVSWKVKSLSISNF